MQTWKISRFSISWTLIVFGLGWIAGATFFLLFFNISDTEISFPRGFVQKTNSLVKNTENFVHSLEIVSLRGSHFKNASLNSEEIQSIPIFDQNMSLSSGSSSGISYVYLDWPLDDRLFTLENFKSLETILTHYQKAVVRVYIAAPYDAYVHKIGSHLSVTHFQKYKKLGYDIDVIPVAKLDRSDKINIGKAYWANVSSTCCDRCGVQCRTALASPPYHLLTFIRLQKLFKTGGIFSDFSYFFLGAFSYPSFVQGFQLISTCDYSQHIEKWQEEQLGTSQYHHQSCFTSTLLVFNSPRHRAVECVLSRYEQTEFLSCLYQDKKYGGAICIRRAFEECFHVLHFSNDLASTTSSSISISSSLLTTSLSSIGSSSSSSSPIEDFSRDPRIAHLTFWSSSWKLNKHHRALWLGGLTWNGHWNSLPYPNGSLLAAVSESIRLIPDSDFQTCLRTSSSASSVTKCHHYTSKLTLFTPKLLGTSENMTNSTSNGNISREIYSIDTNSINSYESGLEESSCSPSILLPGFMKSASTFLFHALSLHPQIIQPIRGSQMKETQCYHPQPPRKLAKRAWCYPYLSDDENFAIIDGTIYYGTDASVPRSILQDNPNAKAIFAVRHPVDRMYSNYRFAHDTYGQKGSFDNYTLSGTDRLEKFGLLRDLIVNGSREEDIFDVYFNRSFGLGGALGVLFMHSIAYPSIRYYQKILGPQNVYVVPSELLDTRNMTQVRLVLDDIFQFLGLCPYNISNLRPLLPGNVELDSSHQMSRDVYRKLNLFFKPFVVSLMNITGLNLTSWITKEPSTRLPEFSFGFNSSRPRMWFEAEEEQKNDAQEDSSFGLGIMSHLLPKRSVEADSSFNTTLGMLVSF